MDIVTSTDWDMETDGFGPEGETTTDPASLDDLMNQQSLLLQEIDEDLEDGLVDDASLPEEDQDAGTLIATINMPGLQPFDRGKKGIPSSWSNGTVSGDSHLCLMLLSDQSWEFQTILSEFKDAGLTVKMIERIENRDLWEKFAFEEKRMKRKTAVVNEVYLFHGTTAPKEHICHEGLDQRLSRIGYFGRGIYFSNDPRKCVSYTQSEEPSHSIQMATCTVYKCRVLLGDMKVYPPGESAKHLKREPLLEIPEPGGRKYHDSVKGHVLQYDEFVIYKSERVMPEYVISCFMPTAPSTDEAPAVGQTASASANQQDLYGGLDEGEVNAELRTASAKKPKKMGASKGNGLADGSYWGLDEDELSAELKAGALPAFQLKDEETHPEVDEEEDMVHGLHEVDSHQDAGLGELYQSNTHWEVTRKEKRRQLQEVPREGSVPGERIDSSGNGAVVPTETDSGMTVDCHNAGENTSKTGNRTASESHSNPDAPPSHQDSDSAWGSTSDEEHKRQLEAVRSRMKENQPFKSAGVSREQTTVSSKTAESGRYRKEVIDPEFLPTILEVRERVRRARLLENQNKEGEAKKKKTTLSAASRMHLKLNKEPDPTAWAPDELAKHKDLLENIRVKVQADRKREAQDRKKLRTTGNADQQDNSASWAGGDDGIQELLDTLIVQFMEFTACEEIEEAREYVMRASMDVNKAIVSYLNG